jgi:hypothetical protein
MKVIDLIRKERRWDSIVDITTHYRLDGLGIKS